MIKAILIHGAYGHPQENWFPWLKSKLKTLGCQVFVPQFPTPEEQSLGSWLKVFDPYFEKLNQDTILIGHSIAPAFIFSVLEKIETRVRSAFIVAGFVGLLNLPVDEINQTISNKQFDWIKIKQNCKKFYVINSDNDPYVPLHKGHELAQNLDTKVILAENAGHFNEQSGYTKFDLLLEKIKQEL